jgi:hypothetical protein
MVDPNQHRLYLGNKTPSTYSSGQQERLDALLGVVAHKLDSKMAVSNGPGEVRVPRTLTSRIYFSTPGITPAAPLVGDVTILPPPALTSFTAIA